MEALLAVAGIVCLANSAVGQWRFHRFQAAHAGTFLTNRTKPAALAVPAELTPAPGTAIGRLLVPRLNFSTIIVEGDDGHSLALGAGRSLDSSPLGGTGNTVLAGHRDSAFWPLRHLRAGDRVRVVTSRQILTYIVRTLDVVEPEDTSLLAPTPAAMLTLVTCYPFRHVGPAPKRLVMRASLADPS